MKRIFFSLLSALLLAAPAFSATITEGVDYLDGPMPDLGQFGAGTTTIAGSIEGTCISVQPPAVCTSGVDPWDRITFGLMPGLVLSSLLIDLNGLTGPDGMTMELTFATPDGPATFSNLTPGIYAPNVDGLANPFDITIAGYQADALGAFTLDWTITATVAAVPVPGAAVLLLSALGAAGVLGRRRRQPRA